MSAATFAPIARAIEAIRQAVAATLVRVARAVHDSDHYCEVTVQTPGGEVSVVACCDAAGHGIIVASGPGDYWDHREAKTAGELFEADR